MLPKCWCVKGSWNVDSINKMCEINPVTWYKSKVRGSLRILHYNYVNFQFSIENWTGKGIDEKMLGLSRPQVLDQPLWS